jgi:DNA (cytosine-5)-methyltransferase 1
VSALQPFNVFTEPMSYGADLFVPGLGPVITVDNFAGGGGASTGIEEAIGCPIDVALNHDADACALYTLNHPRTLVLHQSVWRADPVDVVIAASRRRGYDRPLPVWLAWFSPDCTHFSKAKGGRPVKKNIRDLAQVVVHWIERLGPTLRPRVIMLENVEEFQDYGPLMMVDGKHMPDPDRKGQLFNKWKRRIQRNGYTVELRELVAADYGVPTTRKRLLIICRCDGQPIVWPAPTHAKNGKGGLQPWRGAHEIIDWSIPVPSIFTRKKDLVENSLHRVARGVMRFVVNDPDPFIVGIDNKSNGPRDVWSGKEPLRTVTQENRFAMVAPVIAKFRAGSDGSSIKQPLPTVTANSFIKRPGGAAPLGLIAPYLVGCGGPSYAGKPTSVKQPYKTMVGENHTAVAAAFLAQQNTGMVGHSMRRPVSTIVEKGCTQTPIVCRLSDEDLEGAERVTAFLIKYYGSAVGQSLQVPLHAATSKARFGLVMVRGVPITDIGLRMLARHELFRAQGFPAEYRLDARRLDGKLVTNTALISKAGNAVPPAWAREMVNANKPNGLRLAA